MRSSHSSSRGRRKSGRSTGWRQALSNVKNWPLGVLFGFVVLCMTFGGGPGELGASFLLIALAGFALLVTAALQGWLESFQQQPLIVRLAVGLTVALPFIQLIPLPPGMWQALPGQHLRAEILTTFGLGDRWLPLSVSPAETAYSAVIALCMFGLFVACLSLPTPQMRKLVWCMAIVMLIGVLIGLFQLASSGSSFNFHRVSHRGLLIGFFANKNHMGLMIACLVPVLYALTEPRHEDNPGAFAFIVIGWVLALSLAVATNSRAGLGLTLFAIAALTFRRFPQARGRVALVGGGILVALGIIVATVPAIGDLFERVGDAKEDLRVNLVDQAMPLVGQYGLTGSGLGSFAQIYAPTEKLEWVTPQYVNHVHNDFIQLVIEAGVFGVALLVLWAAALVVAMRGFPKQATLRPGSDKDSPAFAWLGFIIVILFAAHSVVDYPIRRVAALAILVIALAMVLRPLGPRIAASRQLPAGNRGRSSGNGSGR